MFYSKKRAKLQLIFELCKKIHKNFANYEKMLYLCRENQFIEDEIVHSLYWLR